MWKQCPKCESQCPTGEGFCGNCGVNLLAHEKELVKKQEQRLEELRTMVQHFELNEAVLAAYQLANEQSHPCLESVQAETKQFIDQVVAERDRLKQVAESVIDQAGELLRECSYDAAIERLESIPVPLRAEQSHSLLAEARDKSNAVAALKAQLRQRDGIDNHQRLEAIQQLLRLKPNDEQIRQWAEQLRDHVLKASLGLIQKHDYGKAVELLRKVPESVCNKLVTDAERRATELHFLASELQLAPEVTTAVLHAGRRLVQLDAKNKQAAALLQELLQQKKLQEAKSPGHPIPWVVCPQSTSVGVTVEAGGMPRRTCFTSPEAEHAFAADPGRFYAACGLALQGLGRANVPVNLLSTNQQSVMSLLRRPIRARPVTSAWGVANGTLGTAAIRMVLQDDQPAIQQCVYLPHPQPLTHPNIKSKQHVSVLHTLRVLTSRHTIEGHEPVIAQLPAAKTLVRYLQLPNANDKKLQELISYEARHQIPFPLDRVSFDTHLFDLPDLPDGVGQRRGLLIAATSEEIEQQKALYEHAEIKLHALECDAVALHNWVHHEYLLSDAEPLSEQNSQLLATLEMGHAASILVFSSANGVWFRTVSPAGDDFVKGLVERFQLTHDVAFQVLCSPFKAKRMSDVHEQNCQLFADLLERFPRALTDAKNTLPEVELNRLLVTGESGCIPGLLRFLRFGR